jgi:hypothetical protein
MKKWAHEFNREVSKEEIQIDNKYIKKCSVSLAIKEMLRFHFTPVRIAIFKGKTTNDSEDAVKQEPLYTISGNAN